MNILIVDDSSTMRMIVIKQLRQAGFTKSNVLEAGSAREALQKLAAGGVDLMLADVNMPEITGIELVKVVKTKMKDLPVIMITTETSPEMKEKMLAAGALGVIAKPRLRRRAWPWRPSAAEAFHRRSFRRSPCSFRPRPRRLRRVWDPSAGREPV